MKPSDQPLHSTARQALFDGEILTSRNRYLTELCDHALHMISNAFFGLDAESAHAEMAPSEYRRRVVELRKAINHDTAVRSLLVKLVAAWGAEPKDTFADALRLRVAPPDEPGLTFPLAPLPAHRDTWGSNVMQQINVWIPLNEVTKDRSLIIWPDHFAQVVPNDSAGWDLDILRAVRSDHGKPYPLLPTASQSPPSSEGRVLLPKRGEAVVFSGAHLHASVPNQTEAARLNIEFRLVVLSDFHANRGAKNIDGAAPRTAWHWFRELEGARNLADVASLPAIL